MNVTMKNVLLAAAGALAVAAMPMAAQAAGGSVSQMSTISAGAVDCDRYPSAKGCEYKHHRDYDYDYDHDRGREQQRNDPPPDRRNQSPYDRR